MANPSGYYALTNDEWIKVCKELNLAEIRVFFYLKFKQSLCSEKLNLQASDIAQETGLNKGTVSRALTVLQNTGWINAEDYGLKLYTANRIECVIRDRLKAQLGGLSEVITPAGRIDLLSDTELIEVKPVNEWKSGLGQGMVYSGFYPEHRKRLHLFGTSKDEKHIAMIANSCLPFDVFVSFEIQGI